MVSEAHTGKRAHSRVHAVHRAAVTKHAASVFALPLNRGQQPACDPDRLPRRDLTDKLSVQVGRPGDRPHCHRTILTFGCGDLPVPSPALRAPPHETWW